MEFKEEQKIAIIIPLIYLFGVLIHNFVARFRIVPDLHWIFSYGSILGWIISLGAVSFSGVYSIIIFKDLKTQLKYKFFWFLIAASPFLYVMILLGVIMLE